MKMDFIIVFLKALAISC